MFNTVLFNAGLFNAGYQPVALIYHYLIDGSYRTRSLINNRLVVIGNDDSNAPVYGYAENTTEQDLVGERLDFKHTPMAYTATVAGEVAAAIMAKARLEGVSGFISLPPNCGQQLYDVIAITDSMAAQAAIARRVLGLRLLYSSKEPQFIQQIQLGEV